MMGWRDFFRFREAPQNKYEVKPDKPNPGPTIVYLRSTSTPVQHWESKVLYDAWGTPYIKSEGSRAQWGSTRLYSDGRTDSVYGTQWKHKSGPPVTFGNKPANPFDRDPS